MNRKLMMNRRKILTSLMLTAMALPAWGGDRPPAGLLFHRSGLPATLPLVVKTFPGKDYVIFLIAPDDGQAVMAGYIRGGEHFRLVVPPGRWRIRFAYGRDWQGEDALFGEETEWASYDEVLEFGAGTRNYRGHIITLIEENGRMIVVRADPEEICQRGQWIADDLRPSRPYDAEPDRLWQERRLTVRRRICDATG